MNLAQIENNLKLLVYSLDKETFIYNLLESYYLPKASISRLQKGSLNLSKVPGEVSWKKKLFFKEEHKNDLHLTISSLKDELKHNQRFVIVTDYKTLLAIDTLTKDQLDIPITDLPKYYDFFLPWAGMEKATHAAENPADVKAAEKMAKLFDEIKKDNPDTSAEFIHNLNIFFSRLLFCYFAEDTNIFEDNQFSHAVESHTRGDGSDLDAYLNRLFWVLNSPVDKRGDIPNYLNAFPYVNGGLFREEIPCPKFTSKSRQLLIDSGDSNDWSAINPDIFGSMFQAVISPEHRCGLGAHYTSVPNIMKVIEPLFLNELKEAFEDAIGNEKKLKELLHRIAKIKLFDPACGSGNFLIIAYKELRRLEMLILKELGGFAFSGIHLNNFFGIELDDFAHEIAKLSLWLAEHQMNVEFFNEFGRTNPTLPLQEAGQIFCGNACRLDWEKVCPKNEGDEIYIMGNPPYLGQRNQKEIHRKDLDLTFLGQENYKNLDYVSAWFYLGSKYISNTSNKLAFVSTNSITQGTQVKMLWDKIFLHNTEINFAYKDFKWTNNAKSKANVTVCIIGLSNKSNSKKVLYIDGKCISTNSISPFLTVGASIIIPKRNSPLSCLPQMIGGNQPREGGYLILNEIEKNKLSSEYPGISRFFRKLVGNTEFVNGTKKWCIWINQNELFDALQYKEIARRVDSVKLVREQGNSLEKNFINFSYRFVQINEAKEHQIVIPVLSSERRQYLPIGFYDKEVIVLGSVNVIFDPDIFVFGILSSTMHYLWAREFSLKYASNIKYSTGICFNTFPFPDLSNSQKNTLELTSIRIIEERERFSQFSISELYEPDKMPEGLKEAHRLNDEAVERCYRSTPFHSDEERLEYLFKLYEKMIQEEKEKGTLFEAEKRHVKRNKNMPDIVHVEYKQTGQSKSTNQYGMREMQEKAFEARDAQYLLLKAPPASGKSRALMFLALDKLSNQGIKKIIVAVPERSIGSSFAKTDLKKFGFFANWEPNDNYNLCTPGSDGSSSKVQAFHNFMKSTTEQILICTHATLRFACEGLEETVFNDSLLAIDEFHHVSADVNNRLGDIIRNIMQKSTAHLIAMTGSYFRGDSVPVLHPDDEAKFTKVTYNYYQQLNGYDFLKSLGIGYHFYQGKYTDSIMEVLDLNKKTILHIPNVNSGESTKDKHNEVDYILDQIGTIEKQDHETGVIYVKKHSDGKILKVADLVEDTPRDRDRIVAYLREIKSVDDMDLIIALGMAKEGFDWPYCEHALTVGYRGSLTEIIQIIGRATRDSSNKVHAQFTNLIAQPDAHDDEVKLSVNNMLKAITASLLMEQVLAPNWKFKTKLSDDDVAQPGEIKIRGLKEPSSKRVKEILESDLNDLKATILQDDTMLKAMPGNVDPEVINKVLIPKIIRTKYPDLTAEEVEEVRQNVVVDSVIKNGEIKEVEDKRFIRMAGKFVNIDDIHIDLIDRVNPFQKAFEILSKSVTTKVLRIIQETIEATRINMDFEEARILWPKVQEFVETFKREPNIDANDPLEKRMAECVIYLKEEKRKRLAQQNDGGQG